MAHFLKKEKEVGNGPFKKNKKSHLLLLFYPTYIEAKWWQLVVPQFEGPELVKSVKHKFYQWFESLLQAV